MFSVLIVVCTLILPITLLVLTFKQSHMPIPASLTPKYLAPYTFIRKFTIFLSYLYTLFPILYVLGAIFDPKEPSKCENVTTFCFDLRFTFAEAVGIHAVMWGWLVGLAITGCLLYLR